MESATFLPAAVEPVTARSRIAIPWRGWVAVGSVACLPVGLLWDISWHETIGRDTFWTPAHIIIQLGGIVPALLFAWLALKTTFRGTLEERAASVSFWGMRAPLGAWVTMWGAAAMVTSAPFDNWWHDTYGLDVQIVSPPHSILGLGMLAVTVGVLLYVFSWQNRAGGPAQKFGALLCALAAGVMLTLFSDFLTEFSYPNQQHSGDFYRISSAVFPMALVLTARASRLRWPATLAAAAYMSVLMLMVWILPLFPGHPKLGPIYNPVTHMVPPPFPLLLVLPALGIDWLMHLSKRLRAPAQLSEDESTLKAPLAGRLVREGFLAMGLSAIFLAVFLPVQWFFSIFLLSDAADNWIFARSGHWPYFTQIGPMMNHFWERWGGGPVTSFDLASCYVLALISATIGLWSGHFLLKVRR